MSKQIPEVFSLKVCFFLAQSQKNLQFCMLLKFRFEVANRLQFKEFINIKFLMRKFTLIFLLLALAYSSIEANNVEASTEEPQPSDDPPLERNIRDLIKKKQNLVTLPVLFPCGQSSIWKFLNVPAGNTLYIKFESSFTCQHRLVINSPCNKYTAKYITTDPSVPMSPTPITFTQILQPWQAPISCPSGLIHMAEATHISPIVGLNTLQYQFSFLRTWVRFKGTNGVWGSWAKHHSGQRKIWFA